MTAIHVLPEHVQNKIAAGEVVERPSSAVKELVENALDAGAGQVRVEIQDGGRRFIRVVDDGRGMSADDLALAVQRHATSKIADVEDIFRIRTMGFRGEALPAIAAVARLTIASARAGDDQGHELAIEAGRALRLAPAPPRPGTRVEVADLFFNTPARHAFMRSAPVESAAIAEMMSRVALAYPEVGFRLISGGRDLLDVPAGQTLLARIGALFKGVPVDRLARVYDDAAGGLVVDGYAAPPPTSHSNSLHTFILLNRRWIRHPGLAYMVAEAYRGRLPARRYPFVVLDLTLDPARVDVNVHPAKEEVRFADTGMVVSAVRRAVTKALGVDDRAAIGGEGGGAPAIRPPLVVGGATLPSPPGVANAANANVNNERVDGRADGAENFRAPSGQSTPRRGEWSGKGGAGGRRPESAPTSPFVGAGAKVDFNEIRDRLREADAAPVASAVDPVQSPPPADAAERSAAPAKTADGTDGASLFAPLPRHRVIGQAAERYLIVEGPEGLLFVDPHALHERWNYERLKGRLRPLERQALLLPLVVELSPREAALAEGVLPVLRELGFEVEPFGEMALSISAAPSLLPSAKLATVIKDVLADIEEAGRTVERVREGVLASLACRASVLLGTGLRNEEVCALLDMLFDAGQPPTCPHGRPTAVTISWRELDRRFARS